MLFLANVCDIDKGEFKFVEFFNDDWNRIIGTTFSVKNIDTGEEIIPDLIKLDHVGNVLSFGVFSLGVLSGIKRRWLSDGVGYKDSRGTEYDVFGCFVNNKKVENYKIFATNTEKFEATQRKCLVLIEALNSANFNMLFEKRYKERNYMEQNKVKES